MLESAMTPNATANEAMKMAIIGFFCVGFVLGPVAIVKAVNARKEIQENIMLTGWGKANAALVLGIVVTLINVLNFVGKVAK